MAGQPFHRNQVTRQAIAKTKTASKLDVNNHEVAAGYAFHYLHKCGFIKPAGAIGIFQLAKKNVGHELTSDQYKRASWALFSCHRRYNSAQLADKKKRGTSSITRRDNHLGIMQQIRKVRDEMDKLEQMIDAKNRQG